MTITAEVKGATADRFRAYTKATMTRKPTVADHIKRAESGKPALKAGTKVAYEVEEVAVEGAITGSALAFTSEPAITRVAFYVGPVEDEVCVGSVEVGAAGDIEIELAEPDDDGEVITEQDL